MLCDSVLVADISKVEIGEWLLQNMLVLVKRGIGLLWFSGMCHENCADEDFAELIRAAHAAGLKVGCELLITDTTSLSDQESHHLVSEAVTLSSLRVDYLRVHAVNGSVPGDLLLRLWTMKRSRHFKPAVVMVRRPKGAALMLSVRDVSLLTRAA